MTHPHNLAAVAAWWKLLEAEPWIRDTIDAEAESGRASRPTRPRDAATLRRLGQHYASERAATMAGRVASARAGLTDTSKGLGAIPDITDRIDDLLDAEVVANRAKFDLLQLIGEAATDSLDNAIDPATVLDVRTLEIPDALRELDQWRAHEAATALAYADRVVRQACRIADRVVPYEGMCPACGAYGLVWETAAPDSAQWTVLCAYGCRCEGEPCECGLPVRVRGTTHRWEPSVCSPEMIGALPSAQVRGRVAA